MTKKITFNPRHPGPRSDTEPGPIATPARSSKPFATVTPNRDKITFDWPLIETNAQAVREAATDHPVAQMDLICLLLSEARKAKI